MSTPGLRALGFDPGNIFKHRCNQMLELIYILIWLHDNKFHFEFEMHVTSDNCYILKDGKFSKDIMGSHSKP